VVTSVDASGPAGDSLQPTDIIEAANDRPLPSFEHWRAIASRLTAGEKVSLKVRRKAAVHTLTVTAAPLAAPLKASQLGLKMRTIRGVGVEVLAVASGSAAARAGIQEGDVITVTGDRKAPTAAQVTRSFTGAKAGVPVLVAVTRGPSHYVLTLEPR
jgi:S1-C subfamily serine protease